ncbi:MAG TPA: TRAP transporter substrate-binding protein [Burkholderiaceae bacterium]|nr:TRAP transporter substrate-binding protein [Burkholderiaceae bacterium]
MAPAVVVAQSPITLRFQSTWPTKDIFHELALDFAKKLNEMSGGRLRIEMLPSGAVAKPFDVLDAVHRGLIDGGHGVSAYWYPKNSAFSLFGTGPAVGLDGNMLLAWMEYGGGRRFYDSLLHDTLKLNVEGFLYGPLGPQPFGWFRKPIAKVEDLRGLKYRTIGLAADMMRELGAVPSRLAGQEIVQALDRELVDAAEFNNPSSDRALGFPEVVKLCYLQSYHQASEVFEVLVNKRRYESLPASLRPLFRLAAHAASADLSWKTADRYAQDFHDMRTRMGVKFVRTPEEILRAQLVAWKRVVQIKSAENPLFAEIVRSQQEFARRAMGYQIEATVSQHTAYEFWYGRR